MTCFSQTLGQSRLFYPLNHHAAPCLWHRCQTQSLRKSLQITVLFSRDLTINNHLFLCLNRFKYPTVIMIISSGPLTASVMMMWPVTLTLTGSAHCSSWLKFTSLCSVPCVNESLYQNLHHFFCPISICSNLEYGQKLNMERNSPCKYHCGPDAFGTKASTDVRWAGKEQLSLKTVHNSRENTSTTFSSFSWAFTSLS